MAEKKSPVFDWETGEFKLNQGAVVAAKESDAVVQVVLKAQVTPRGKYLIYADAERPDYNHKYGSDVFNILTHSDLTEATRLSELKRAVVEAIKYDPWVLDVYDVVIDNGKELTVSFTIDTIYDKNTRIEGVAIND